MEFIEAPVFTRMVSEYLIDDSYRELQSFLMENPEAGDLIQGSGGFRKVRWVDPRRGKGKRGGLRVIYFHFPEEEQIWLMTVYDKNEAEDLSSAQKKILKGLIDLEKQARVQTRKRN